MTVIVLARSSGVNAPAVRWPQLVKPDSDAHDASDVQGTAGFLNWLVDLLRQKPQKTFGWPGRSTAVLLSVPVVKPRMSGTDPMFLGAGGGQS